MQVADLANMSPTKTMEVGRVLFENDARYFTGTVVKTSRSIRIRKSKIVLGLVKSTF